MTDKEEKKYDHLEEASDDENPSSPTKFRNDLSLTPTESFDDDSSKDSILKTLYKKIKALLSRKKVRVALILVLLFIANLKFLGLDGECP